MSGYLSVFLSLKKYCISLCLHLSPPPSPSRFIMNIKGISDVSTHTHIYIYIHIVYIYIYDPGPRSRSPPPPPPQWYGPPLAVPQTSRLHAVCRPRPAIACYLLRLGDVKPCLWAIRKHLGSPIPYLQAFRSIYALLPLLRTHTSTRLLPPQHPHPQGGRENQDHLHEWHSIPICGNHVISI